jgi:tetratricopeptide (TPR) repeat protein/tRNA A-37 threonylcarbamoyl transferase component Bud32
MGAVYVAEQTEPVRRRVALKVMKPGIDTRQVVARFEAERQALAVMDHPNIAKVLDGGASETGRPYFVMELVRGVPITAYCDMHRLSTRDRLALFIPVCQAVQHAHQKGVIHRDLKPSNVMVAVQDDRPVPKVIDFGIAKAVSQPLTERTLVTDYGQVIGTPAYMSPEQAEASNLDVDTRTDIYSLGVMLYELLVGRLPLDPQELGIHAFFAQLVMRDTSPPTPSGRLSTLGGDQSSIASSRQTDASALRKELKGDLDWVVMKAMDPDRTRRYETVNGLAVDLQRYLNDEPVAARPPSAGYRLAKFVKRHRAVVVAGAAAAAALVIGASLATLGLVRARRAEAVARQEAETVRQVADFLVGLFKVSDPGEARGNTITAREILDKGAQQITTELGSQPAVQARLMQTMGQVYSELGLYDAARPLLERAVALRQTLRDPDQLGLAAGLTDLASVARRQGTFAQAESLYHRALAIREAALGPDHPDVAAVLNGLGGLLFTEGKYGEAEPILKRAMAVRENALGPNAPELGSTVRNLGALYWAQKRYADAEAYLQRALDIYQRAYGPEHLEVAASLNNLGAVLWTEKKYAQAEPLYARAQQIYEKMLGPEHPDVASVLNNLGELAWAQKKYAEAEPLFRRSLDIKRKVLKPDHPSIAVSWNGLANVLRDEGRYREAEALYQQALALRERMLGPNHSAVAETLRAYAELLRKTGRGERAGALEARARAISP